MSVLNNLFFVYTPFQFFVAQQIINQEKLENNILLLGFVGGNVHFYKTYHLMKIDVFWKDIYYLDKLPEWAYIDRRHVLKSIFRLFKYDRLINRILRKHYISAFYLGDINNFSCKFAATRFGGKEIKIIFFEEGCSHYAFQQHPQRGGYIINSLCSLMVDVCIYLPYFHFCYGKYRFLKDRAINQLPIYKRYSIVPLYRESFDRQLYVKSVFSDKLRNYIREENEHITGISNEGQEKILFLSQPLYDIVGEIEAEFSVLTDYFSTYRRDVLIIIKFHPREIPAIREGIILLLEKFRLDYYVLSDQYSLPIEIFLQCISFDHMVTFASSTILYAGYIYKYFPVEALLDCYIEECKRRNFDVSPLLKGREIFERMNIKMV